MPNLSAFQVIKTQERTTPLLDASMMTKGIGRRMKKIVGRTAMESSAATPVMAVAVVVVLRSPRSPRELEQPTATISWTSSSLCLHRLNIQMCSYVKRWPAGWV